MSFIKKFIKWTLIIVLAVIGSYLAVFVYAIAFLATSPNSSNYIVAVVFSLPLLLCIFGVVKLHKWKIEEKRIIIDEEAEAQVIRDLPIQEEVESTIETDSNTDLIKKINNDMLNLRDQQLIESWQILITTTNPDTFFIRLDYFEKRANPTIEKDELTSAFIDRYYEKTK